MKLTAHEEYGLRCLLQIGKQGPEGSMTIPEVSRQEGISVPHAANAVYYAEIVRDKATLRALIHASTEILRDAYDTGAEPNPIGIPGGAYEIPLVIQDRQFRPGWYNGHGAGDGVGLSAHPQATDSHALGNEYGRFQRV